MARTRLIVDIEGNSAKLVSEVEKSRKSIRGMSADLKLIKFDSIVNLGERAFHAGQQVYNFAKGIASAANDIQRNAKTLNMSTAEYQQWTYVAKMADLQTEDLMNGVRFLTKSISESLQGTGDAAKAFNLLGINLKDSTGKTKDQQTVLFETIGTLGKFADGVDRDSLMLAIFGRSWMTMKPLVDAGTDAIKDWQKEAVKMGTVIGDVVLEKGSQAETQFKKLESQINATKISFAPLALEAAKFFASLLDGAQKFFGYVEDQSTKDYWGKGWIGKVFGGKGPLSEGIGAGGEASSISFWTSPYGEHKTMPAAGKPQAPKMPSKGEYPEWRKTIGEERAAYEEEYWIQQRKLWEVEDNLLKIEGERAQQLADDMFPSMEQVNRAVEQGNKYYEEQRTKLIAVQTLVKDFGWEDYAGGADASSDATRTLTVLMIENTKAAEKLREANQQTNDTLQTIGSSLSGFGANIITLSDQTTSFSDRVKNAFSSMADSIINDLLKATVQMAIFGNMQGQISKGASGWGTSGQSGYGGIISLAGSLIGLLGEGGILRGGFVPIRQFAYGGIADRPTLGLIGEGGNDEAVVPLKSGAIPVEMNRGEGRGGNMILVLPWNYDKSFAEMIKRNPDAVISLFRNNIRGRGSMVSTIRSTQ